MSILDIGSSGGILGTGICLNQQCKDTIAANNAYKMAEANLINQQASSKTSYTWIVVIVIVVLIVMGGLAYFLLKKPKIN